MAHTASSTPDTISTSYGYDGPLGAVLSHTGHGTACLGPLSGSASTVSTLATSGNPDDGQIRHRPLVSGPDAGGPVAQQEQRRDAACSAIAAPPKTVCSWVRMAESVAVP